MKKILFVMALVLSMTFMTMAEEQDNGLFNRKSVQKTENVQKTDTNDPEAPLGSGIAVLLGLGGCYALSKAKKQD